VAQRYPTQVSRRIRDVEHSLSSGIRIEGEAAPRWNLAERMAFYGIPGLGLAVVNDGQVEWAKSYGVVEAGRPTPVVETTLFQAASISKPITALGALKLVEQGLLRLDEDVNARLKTWRVPESEFTREKKVTLRGLLSHTAGLSTPGFWGYPSDSPIPTLPQILDGQPPAVSPPVRVFTAPGTRFAYSGGGCCVTQQLCEDVTGQPFAELFAEMLFKPLGMSHSTFEQPLPPSKNLMAARGHQGDGSPYAGDFRVFPELAAAGLWTTPSDLARAVVEVYHSYQGIPSAFLSTETAREMLAYHWEHQLPVRAAPAPVLSPGVGLGFGLSISPEALYFSHGGGNLGFLSFLLGRADQGQGVAMMTNSNLGMVLGGEILMSLAEVYGWPEFNPAVHTRVTVSEAVLQEYAGDYEIEPGRLFKIRSGADQLKAELDWFAPRLLDFYPYSESDFFSTQFPYLLRFVRDEAGRVTSVVDLMGQFGPGRKV
jgi:CubicO group peptidase (beta-lactamase class C family)